MRTTIPLLSLLLFGGAAHAASNEIGLELGSFGAHDPSWAMFSNNEQLGTFGARAGVRLTDRIGIVASWHNRKKGGSLDLGGDYYYDSSYDSSYDSGYTDSSGYASINTAFVANQLMVGPKADIELLPSLLPYVTVQAVGMFGTMRLDDDLDHDDNANQLTFHGFAPGAYGALGLDFVPTKRHNKVRFATYAEAGYGWQAPMALKDKAGKDGKGGSASIGNVQFSGFAMRFGVGLHF